YPAGDAFDNDRETAGLSRACRGNVERRITGSGYRGRIEPRRDSRRQSTHAQADRAAETIQRADGHRVIYFASSGDGLRSGRARQMEVLRRGGQTEDLKLINFGRANAGLRGKAYVQANKASQLGRDVMGCNAVAVAHHGHHSIPTRPIHAELDIEVSRV